MRHSYACIHLHSKQYHRMVLDLVPIVQILVPSLLNHLRDSIGDIPNTHWDVHAEYPLTLAP